MISMISPTSQDRLLFLGLGITTCAVFTFVRHRLHRFREAAIIPPTENKSHFIDQKTEDSLQLETLHKLLNNPNYGIQETASIIVCERALHNEFAINTLLDEISRPEYEHREKAIRAFIMMVNSSTVARIHKPETYEALVKSLEYSVEDYEHHGYDPDWDNWYLRDVAETSCLRIIHELICKYDVGELLSAGFIERWLVKEPWGKTEEERCRNFLDSLKQEKLLNRVLVPIFNDEKGRKRLEEVNLIPPRPVSMTNHLTMEGSGDQYMEQYEGMFTERRSRNQYTDQLEGVFTERRPRDQSTAGEHLRRRHREAMVLNDGTRPLERGDIYEHQQRFRGSIARRESL